MGDYPGGIYMDSVAAETAPRLYQQYIAGAWVDAEGGRVYDDFDPYDGSVVARVPNATRADTERAIEAATKAFPAWAALPPIAKQKLFLRAADIVERRIPDLVSILARETGCGRAFAMFQIQWSINLLRQVSNWGYLPVGEVFRSDGPGKLAMAIRKPLGVVAGITPWNGAHNLAWRTALLPMAFGNTMVLKPSEESPIAAGLVLAEILHEAEFPAGVFNVITHAPGAAGPVADAIFESPAVRSINFTGSSATGRMLAERAGKTLKRIVLELGGYNPLIVLRDADIQQAIDTTAFGAFFHQGQICMNTRKVLVERPIAKEYIERLVAKTEGIKIGDPKVPSTVIGPLINDRALEMVRSRVAEAISQGARLLTGGKHDGRLYHPTILTDVPANSIVNREETFGPVLIVEAVDSAEEALAKATNTRYGLCASILTGDHEKGLALAERVDAGMVHVNGPTMAGEPALPNGGVKDSGWGRSGHHAVEDFTEVRLTTVTRGVNQFPF
jgi:acyl-CoA reductase-like NAD-dependent aldehyde dehydrogenase